MSYLTVFTRSGPRRYLPRNPFARVLQRLNTWMTDGASAQISLALLPIGPEQALRLVRRFYGGPVELT